MTYEEYKLISESIEKTKEQITRSFDSIIDQLKDSQEETYE